ncbi:lariat debranching enzyme [Clydaea vesicula]|uniref:Lariat debranching enzyme n=1 Tax=Clydaea vesicula TaxID=447962 RepID=A0AAD5XZR0_9FUNG|nr:lariat debranching enzyme [Clydaea vesicula]
MVRIAVQGCCHGELDKIFTAIKHIQKKENVSIDLLIICGDFQSIRNTADLESLACPEKYRSLGTFHHYYNKLKKPPCPVVFIGGNHEASNYLWELYHGGWVASDIYFMGFAGVINFGGLRIAGLSGIYKQLHYDCGHFESQPMVGDDMRSIYHVRKFNIFRLAQIKEPLDIFISHDWPRGIANHGNHEKLLSTKSFLAEELRTNTLGSIPNEFLLKRLKPTYWFAAHMHVLFAAIYEHNKVEVSSKAVTKNPDEIEIESDEEIDENGTENQKKKESVVKEEKATPMRKFTKFLALDKCVGDRSYLQIIDLPTDASEPYKFEYDREWLSIMKATNSLISFERRQPPLPEEAETQK